MNTRQIKVEEYNKNWPVLFKQEKALLISILGDFAVKIDHIGSTAVPNLAAKPIIDILLEVTNINQLDEKTSAFRAAGYQAKGANGISGRRYFQKGGNKRTHHLHAFQSGDDNLHRHRAFKEYLIAHPAIAADYALIKQKAAIACSNNNELYMSLKSSFISKYEKLAVEWYHLS